MRRENYYQIPILLLSVCALSSAQTGNITEYAVPTRFAGSYGITAGPDGALWFTEYEASKIGRISTSGVITEYATPTPDSAPYDIHVGPDGALWFTEGQGNNIGRITVAGAINEYPVPNLTSFPESIVAGPDGALWFTENTGNSIGRITIAGVVTNEYVIAGNPQGITAGPDGALWFTERLGNKIGRITAFGQITEYPLPTAGANLYGITVGPDGALWFPEANANQIGRITTTGVITEYQVPTLASAPQAITTGPDGALWFTEYEGKIGRVSTAGVITDYLIPTSSSVPLGIATGPDGALWFTESQGGNIARAASFSLLNVSKTHTADLALGQSNAQYTVIVANSGGPTSGTVTVTENVPVGLTLVSMSGAGWNCGSSTCTRSDVLSTNASYPPIAVTVNVASNAPPQLTNQVIASGGGSPVAAANDLTNVKPPVCPSYSFPGSPASAGAGASIGSAGLVTSLPNCVYTSVVSGNPDWIQITSGSSGFGSSGIGYSILANNSGGARTGSFTVLDANGLAVATFNINQAAASCSSLTLAPGEFTFGPGGGSGTVSFNTSPCSWSIVGNPSWIALPASSGTGSSFNFTVQAGSARQAALSINGGALTAAITQAALVCTYSLSDSTSGFGVSRSFLSSGGAGGINIVAPAGCPWTATSSQSFIAISGNASGNGNGSVNYSVAPNSSSTGQSGTIAIAGLLYVINELPVGSPSYSCSANSAASPIRPEGFSERVADIVFTCSGQAPPGGLTGDVFVNFNTGITNLLLTTGQSDALLLEDEPTPANLSLGANAFRGVISSANGREALLFPALQLASVSGGTFLHTWRITNARVNAQALAPESTVQAVISITATAPFIVNGQPAVATVSFASAFSVLPSSAAPGQTTQPVTFTEGFASAFRSKLAAGQDPSQAGTAYNSESGYVNTSKLGAQTGFAASGTRLIVAIANLPAGVTVYAPLAPSSGANAELISGDATGEGGFPVPGTSQFSGITYRQVTVTAGAGTATWEVTAADPANIETLTFNLLLVNPNGVNLGGVSYAGALAPLSAGPAPQLPGTILPVPRFASATIQVAQPSTVSLSVAPVTTITQGSPNPPTPANSATGGMVSWTQLQANTGSSTAPGAVVMGTLPAGWAITGCTAVDSAGVCPTLDSNNPSNSYTAAYASLSPGQTGTILFTAQSAGQTSGAVEYTASVTSSLANSNFPGSSFTANFPVSLIAMNVTVTGATSFSQGQSGAQYSIAVANSGSLPATLPITVTETLPAGLTLVSMAGAGWTCLVGSASCTRTDTLQAGSSFPMITVTVNVASNAPNTVTNQVDAITGILHPIGSVLTNIAAATAPPAAFFSGEAALGNGAYYLQFPNGNLFGYYNLPSFPILYHYDLGFEGFVDGGNGTAYFYDFASGHWFYTSPNLFPYLFDFALNNWLYYFPDTKNPGHYTTNPRYFSNLGTGKILTI